MKRAPSNYEQTRLDGHATPRSQSPVYLLVVIIIAIFAAETFVMFLLSVFPPFSTTAEMLVDSFILVVLVFPLLYFFLFNPLVLHITERKKAQERNESQLKRLAALRVIDMTINASHDLHVTLDVILNEVLSQLKVPATDILLYDRHLQVLEFAAGKGFLTKALQYTSLR